MRLIVQLKNPAKDVTANGETRPSRDQLIELSKLHAEHVEACREAVRAVLPANVEIAPLARFDTLLLTCTGATDVDQVRKAIFKACPAVEKITSDFRLEPQLQPAFRTDAEEAGLWEKR